jgi:hypothetical protein
VLVLGVVVEFFGIFERVTTHGTLLMSNCHVLAEAGRRIETEFTRNTFEVFCRRHTAGNVRAVLRVLPVGSSSAHGMIPHKTYYK